jgi:hypothetical protein
MASVSVKDEVSEVAGVKLIAAGGIEWDRRTIGNLCRQVGACDRAGHWKGNAAHSCARGGMGGGSVSDAGSYSHHHESRTQNLFGVHGHVQPSTIPECRYPGSLSETYTGVGENRRYLTKYSGDEEHQRPRLEASPRYN